MAATLVQRGEIAAKALLELPELGLVIKIADGATGQLGLFTTRSRKASELIYTEDTSMVGEFGVAGKKTEEADGKECRRPFQSDLVDRLHEFPHKAWRNLLMPRAGTALDVGEEESRVAEGVAQRLKVSHDQAARLLSKTSINCFQGTADGRESLILPLTSLIAHSCDHNTTRILAPHAATAGRRQYRMLLVARVDLPADSELTISYLDAEELARPRAQRLERLGFDCGCTFCTDHPEGGAPRPPSVQYTATPDELSRVLVNPLYAAYDGPLQKRLDALAKKQRVRRQLAVRSAMEAVQNVYGQLRETLQKLLDAGALQAADRQIVEFNEMAATIGMRPIAAKE